MRLTKAVITAAAPAQRTLPVQSLVDRDGIRKSVLSLLVNEALEAGIEEVGIVVYPGDENTYRDAIASSYIGNVHFIVQDSPRGYGHAVWSARDFLKNEAFLHIVGDHLFLNTDPKERTAQQIARLARESDCSVSGIQATRESLLPYFGTIGGQRIPGTQERFMVERVSEKPTPTEAEQTLMIPGLRAGHYLCFMGIHVFTPLVMELLDKQIRNNDSANIQLSPILNDLAQREQYLAIAVQGRRFPLDMRYGLLMTQLALALSGNDRDEVLTSLCDLLAQREMK